MSSKGEVFVRIDDAQLQAILAQLQLSGTGTPGGVGPPGPVGPIGPPGQPTGGIVPEGKPKLGSYGIYGNFMPTIPRGVRSAIGLALPEGYGMVREYNMIRWGQRGLYDVQSAYNGVVKGGKSFTEVGGIGVFTNIFTFGILAVIMLKQYLEETQRMREQMKNDVERLTGIDGATYDRWLKIQSDPLNRRNT